MNPIEHTAGYAMIRDFYGDRTAKRSGVPLIAHIHEGIGILGRIGADQETMEAYAVHPLFQADGDLAANWERAAELAPRVVLLALEYRNVANAFLSDKVEKGPDAMGRESFHIKGPFSLSPVPQVNTMLIADKVQNRKDFERHHRGTHARSDELDHYFKTWLKRLGISETHYLTLIDGLDGG